MTVARPAATVAALVTVALASAAHGAFANSGNPIDPTHQGTYSVLKLATDIAEPRNGYGVATPGDGLPSRPFADYFNDADVARFNNVSIPALAAGQFIAVEARAGHFVNQRLFVDFLEPGTNNVVASASTVRYRQTGWQGSPWTYSRLGGTLPAAGTYDVRITNDASTEGGHLAGFGVWSPRTNLPAAGQTVRFQAESYSWSQDLLRNGDPNPNGNEGPGWIDNAGGWIDYEVPGGDAGLLYQIRMRHRAGVSPSSISNFNLSAVLPDGSVTPIGLLAVGGTNGWQNTPWFVSDYSALFSIPANAHALRIQRSGEPHHWDWFEVTATAIPEPGALGLLAPLAVIARRRRA